MVLMQHGLNVLRRLDASHGGKFLSSTWKATDGDGEADEQMRNAKRPPKIPDAELQASCRTTGRTHTHVLSQNCYGTHE